MQSCWQKSGLDLFFQLPYYTSCQATPPFHCGTAGSTVATTVRSRKRRLCGEQGHYTRRLHKWIHTGLPRYGLDDRFLAGREVMSRSLSIPHYSSGKIIPHEALCSMWLLDVLGAVRPQESYGQLLWLQTHASRWLCNMCTLFSGWFIAWVLLFRVRLSPTHPLLPVLPFCRTTQYGG